ncbi:MAG: hypothetical protein JSS38_11195 [Nitrospira sp.]|nr:hypothetical protein [Nitrospira sp.]
MMRYPPCFIRAAALLALVHAGCQTNVSLPAGTVSGEQALENVQCRSIEEWYARYEKEVSQPGSPLNSRRTILAGANLFRASIFVPAFGVPYRPQHAARFHDLYVKSVIPCYEDRKYSRTFIPIRPFLVSTLESFNSDFAQAAEALNGEELWMEKSLKEIDAVPETIEGLERVQTYGREAQEHLIRLWPGERENFRSVVEAKKKIIARRLMAQLDPGSIAPSAYNLRMLYRLGPYLDAAGEGNADALRQRFETMLQQLMKERRDQAEQIPLTMKGREISRNWFENFDRDFADLKFNPAVAQALQTGLRRREKIFEKTKPAFVSKILEITGGNDSRAEQYRSLMDETFPLPVDRKMSAYEAYQQEILDHQKTVLQKLAAKGKTTFQEIHRSLSDLARYLVKGSEK